MTERRLTRREILVLAGAAGVAGAGYLVVRSLPGEESQPAEPADTGPDVAPPSTEPDVSVTRPDGVPSALWSDPDTWGGEVPGEGDVAVVDRPILLDIDAAVAGIRIEP